MLLLLQYVYVVRRAACAAALSMASRTISYSAAIPLRRRAKVAQWLEGETSRVADGICDAHAIRARIEQRLHAAQHIGLIDVALYRAAERSADAAFDQRLRTGRVARGADARHFGDDFIWRLAQVREAVFAARGERHEQQVSFAFDGAFGALQIRYEHRYAKVRKRLCVGDEFCGISELRKEVRRHERADFDIALACTVRIADPFDLAIGRKNRLDALQAVAQADFAKHDLRGERGHIAVSVYLDRSSVR